MAAGLFRRGLIGLSVFIMYLLLTQTEMMTAIMPMAAWYITSYILAPCGLVVQDAVADAMSVEAVPQVDAKAARSGWSSRAPCIPRCRRWGGSR